jgi:hypothetical protein
VRTGSDSRSTRWPVPRQNSSAPDGYPRCFLDQAQHPTPLNPSLLPPGIPTTAWG